MTNNELAKKLIDEYADAIRGDWSEVDGRWVRNDLWKLSALVDSTDEHDIVKIRENLDICPVGGGHWTQYCNEACEANTP